VTRTYTWLWVARISASNQQPDDLGVEPLDDCRQHVHVIA
jgi:hypothetical protein